MVRRLGRAHTLADYLAAMLGDQAASDVTILIHGINVPRDTPLPWLIGHMAYLDNLVHILCF